MFQLKIHSILQWIDRRWRQLSLRWLVIVLSLILCGMMFTIGFGIRTYLARHEIGWWESRQRELVQVASEAVGIALTDTKTLLQVIGSLPFDELEANPERIHPFLDQLPMLLEIAYITQDGRSLQVTRHPPGLLTIDTADQQAEWLSRVKTHNFFLSDTPQIYENEYYLELAVPAVNGVIVARVSTVSLLNRLAQLELATPSSLYLTTSEGLKITPIMLDPQQSPMLASPPEFHTLLAEPDVVWSNRYINSQQVDVLGAATQISDSRWLVFAEIPVSEALRLSNMAWGMIDIGIIVVTLSFGLLCTYFLHRQIIVPLADLQAGAERIGQGTLQFRIPITRFNEVGAVATAFNQMSAQLNEREQMLRRTQDELEARVQERTAALALANQELQVSEQRYRTLFETAPVAIYTTDLNGRCTSANAAAQYRLQMPPPASITNGQTAVLDYKNGDNNPLGLPNHAIEQQLETPQGQRTILTFQAPLYNAENQLDGILGIDLDITEHRQAELALEGAELKYRNLVEQIPAITYTSAPDHYTHAMYVSPQIVLLGFSVEEWLADPELFIRQLHPEDRTNVLEAIEALQNHGKPMQIEYRIYSRDQQLLWLSDQAKLIYDQAGQPLYIQGIRLDITQRKAAEEALHDSVSRIRLIADNLPALIAYVDHEQIYRFANRQFESWYTNPEIVGKHLKEVAGELQYGAIADYVTTALSGTPITFEYARTYPDGHQRFVEIAYVPHIAPNNEVLGFFTLVQDLTERKVAEEQIRASLAEKVLLLKEIHHRVKNNLQIISSLLYLQSQQTDDPQMQAHLQDSQNRVRSMALIHEKLYQAQDQARVDVAEYVQNLTSHLFHTYHSQANNVKLQVVAEQIYLGIDTAMPCGLIINELMSNSLKHAFPNGHSGEIYVSLTYDPAGYCNLVVGDTGVGLPDTFNPLETTSLGLQLVYALVAQLDGEMELIRENKTEYRIRFADEQS